MVTERLWITTFLSHISFKDFLCPLYFQNPYPQTKHTPTSLPLPPTSPRQLRISYLHQNSVSLLFSCSFSPPCLAQTIRSHWYFSINTESLVCVPHSAQKKWTDFDISHLALLLSTPLGMVQIFVSCYFELFTFFKKQNCCNQFLSWGNFFSALS